MLTKAGKTKYFWQQKFGWHVSLLFVGTFFVSMWFDSLREGPALSLFWGAITTNTPVAVVFLFLLVGLATGLFSFTFTKNKNQYKISSDRRVKLEDIVQSSVFNELTESQIELEERDQQDPQKQP